MAHSAARDAPSLLTADLLTLYGPKPGVDAQPAKEERKRIRNPSPFCNSGMAALQVNHDPVTFVVRRSVQAPALWSMSGNAVSPDWGRAALFTNP